MRNRAGTTFIELLIVLAILGMVLGIVATPTLRWRDGVAVRAARDELAAALRHARMAAASAGGAALVLDTDAATFWIATPDSVLPPTDLRDRYGVRVADVEGLLEVHYDALGIGRLSNRSIRLTRGRAAAGVVVSAYGRVRRW